jgi:hypothetical protein
MFDRAVALELVGAGRCACESCAGELTDAELSKGGWRFCRICRCAWQISVINGQAYATSIHGPKHAPPPTAPPRWRSDEGPDS